MEFTVEELAVINAVKDKLYKKLSYTSQDYEKLILDLVGLFKDGDSKLNSKWDNISEADIMFIFISLLAAHKDILNYMVDYRTQESFMSTAKEVTSVTRIANSFGFSIPGHKAARAEFTISAGLGVGETITVLPFTTFVDDNNVSWTYVGEEVELSSDSTIELFQGTSNTISMNVVDFSNETKTRVISDRSIAIGNNHSAVGCTKLSIDSTVYEEVENLYTYNELNQDKYMLGVDPDGLVYVQLQRFIDLNSFTEEQFDFSYIITSGSSITDASNITKTFAVATVDTSIEFAPVVGSFYAGSNMLSKEEIKEAFKAYYASASSLVTIADYKNYVLNVQKTVPEITKCLVIDQRDDTLGGSGDGTNISNLNVAVYALKKDNVILDDIDATETADLLAVIDENNVSGIIPLVNKATSGGLLPLAVVDVELSLTTSAVLATADADSIKDIAYNYIMGRGIGEKISASDINRELALYDFDYFYGAILIGPDGGTIDQVELTPTYYQCYNILDKASDITVAHN